MHEALANCEAMTEAIVQAYLDSLKHDEYEKPEEIAYDFESVNDRLWAQKEAAGLGTRAEFEQEKLEKKEAELEAAKLAKPKGKGKKVKAEK